MIRKSAKASSSSGGPVRGQRATGKRRQKTPAAPQKSARFSSRIQRIQESLSRRRSRHGNHSSTTSQTTVGAVHTQQASPPSPPSRHTARLLRRCARPRTYAPSAASSDAPSPPQNDDNGDSSSEYDDREDDLPSSSADKARESTPPINIDKLGRRPSRYRLVYKSPLGLVDVVTGHDNSTGILQDCHLVDRAYAGKKSIVSINLTYCARILEMLIFIARSEVSSTLWQWILGRAISMARGTGSSVRLLSFD